MSDDEPAGSGWASPSEPSAPPPYYAPPATGSGPPNPPPPPPYGWTGPPPQSPWAYQVPPAAPKPGVVPLRPLGVGELLDGAFTTIRRYPSATLGLAAVVMLVFEAVQVVVQWSLLRHALETTTNTIGNSTFTNTQYSGGNAAAAGGIVFVLGLIVTALLAGMLSTVVSKGVLGRPLSVAGAWAETRPRMWRLIGVTLLAIILVIVFGVVCVLPGILLLVLVGSAAPGVIVLVIGGLLAFVGVVWLQVSLLFAAPIVVFEKQGVWASIKRSIVLVRGAWWRTLGIELLAGIISGVVSSVIVVPFSLLGGIGSPFSTHHTTQLTFTHLLITGIGGFIAGTLVRPFSGSIVALLYVDRRMRAEALDLTLAQAAANPS